MRKRASLFSIEDILEQQNMNEVYYAAGNETYHKRISGRKSA